MINKKSNYIFALRDKDSYSLLKDWLGEEKVIYVPDIVMAFRYNRHEVQRKNIGICFRNNYTLYLQRNIQESFPVAIQPKIKLSHDHPDCY